MESSDAAPMPPGQPPALHQQQAHSDRPSFATFWKRSKESTGGRQLTFVDSNAAGQPPSTATGNDGEGSSSQAAKNEKAQLRRAQVRKAQIQHRQRKVNYVKTLELDIAGIREMIAQVDKDRRALRSENEAIRARLNGTVSPRQQMPLPMVPQPGENWPLSATETLFSDIDMDDLTITMQMDEDMGTPIYQITSSPTSIGSPGFHSSPQSQVTSTSGGRGLPPMTPEQTQQAINFILSLEHICWGHFRQSNYDLSANPSGRQSGHTMMASSLALRTAPPEVFSSINQTKLNLWNWKKSTRDEPVPQTDVSWQASGLTLQSLYGLACSLNTSDKDLTPVQAWFELAGQYDLGLLLRADVVRQLKEGFAGVVKCPHYGAVMERGAFESIVGRVVGGALAGGDEVGFRGLEEEGM